MDQCELYRHEVESRLNQLESGGLNTKGSNELRALIATYESCYSLMVPPSDPRLVRPRSQNRSATTTPCHDSQFATNAFDNKLPSGIAAAAPMRERIPPPEEMLDRQKALQSRGMEAAAKTVTMQNDLGHLSTILSMGVTAQHAAANTATELERQKERMQGMSGGLQTIGQNVADANKVLSRVSAWVNQFRS